MKSSKIETILNYVPPLENEKAASPLTYYQPFQSSFDPEFAATLRQNQPLWGNSAAESPTRCDSSGLRARARALTPLKTPLPEASTSVWGVGERRSLCNTTWRTPAPLASKPTFPTYGNSPSSSTGAYSQIPPKDDSVFSGLGHRRPEPGNSRMQGSDGGMSRSAYYPLMLSPLEKNISQNVNKAGHNRPKMCNFCRNNKEVPDIYLNHYLYDPETKVLSCPVLRKHVCEICGGTGDQAHTLQYCPVNRERGLQAKVPVLLKTRTITNSTGKIRRN